MGRGKPMKTIVLRGLANVSFFVAAIVMFASYQKVDEESFNFIARYNDWNGFMFCAVVNCIGCLYNLVVLIIPSGSQLWKTVIVLDVIVNMVVGISLGAGWQTYLMVGEGNIHAKWWPICGVVPYFCARVLGSLITSTFGFAVAIALLICTLHVSVDPFLVGNQS
ncbi:UNVERIFIED_CONTAM: CASP-like protein 1B1 [Sesamum radiatum]|uniref:CASP-like protein n=1 Tax=Sesamum radiatum TaxID=300843 RepID=A0AAW2K4D9_SESRA